MSQIRLLTAGDLPALIAPLREMGAFYDKEPPAGEAAWLATLQADGPDGGEAFEVLAAVEPAGLEDGSEIVAFLTFSPVYDLSRPGRYALIRDLFVTEARRRQGLGRALMAALAALCRERGWARIDWRADRLDFDARTFYDTLCPESFKVDRLSYRIEGDEIARLAALAKVNPL
ncbi:MAG: GNAT family N-acetyltransferase [Alphaproteobacteria bacterium]|nr:GNAT family N-acetyltransferase [Alphaproteobacteria bacterium]